MMVRGGGRVWAWGSGPGVGTGFGGEGCRDVRKPELQRVGGTMSLARGARSVCVGSYIAPSFLPEGATPLQAKARDF